MQISPRTWNFIKEHESDDIRTLALQTKKYPDIDMPTAICQIAGRKIAAEKIPSWHTVGEIIYPSHLPLEQCSSETTARFKSTLIKGVTLVDLTGGFGIDCAFLSENFQQVTYVERQQELYEIAKHNFSTLGLNHITCRNEDSVEYLRDMAPVDCIYIDPARRNKHGGKTFLISDCEPNIQELEELLMEKAEKVLVKLSPMLDLSLSLKSLTHAKYAYIISVKNECKELLLVLEKNKTREIPINCINIPARGNIQTTTFTRETEQKEICEYTDKVETYLYEPNASILKAGAFKYIARKYQLKKLHPNSHLYTSDKPVEEFPGKKFHVLEYSQLKNKEILKGIKKADISVRNLPLTTNELRKLLKVDEGGEIHFFGTTLNNNKRILIKCRQLSF